MTEEKKYKSFLKRRLLSLAFVLAGVIFVSLYFLQTISKTPEAINNRNKILK